MYNTYCFSTAKIVKQTLLNITPIRTVVSLVEKYSDFDAFYAADYHYNALYYANASQALGLMVSKTETSIEDEGRLMLIRI